MKRARFLAWSIGVLVTLPRGPSAADSPGSGAITEAEFLSRLHEEHPAVVALGNVLAEAEGELRTPRIQNPEVSFEREAPEGAGAQSTVALRWQPPLDGRAWLAGRAAGVGHRAAEQQHAAERLRLHGELRALFARWSLATDRHGLFSGLAARIAQLADRARARADSGEESGLSARRLELAAAEARGALGRAEADLLRVHAEIRTVFPDLESGLRPVSPALPPPPPTEGSPDPPDVRARELEAARADLVRRASGRFLQMPWLVGGWTRLEEGGVEQDGPVVGLEWAVPLFDRRQGERARARRDAEVAHARWELSRSRAAADREAAYAAYTRLRAAALEVAGAVEGTAAILTAVTAEFHAGEATLTDLLETLRSVTDSRLAALDLHGEALAGHRWLERTVGRPLTGGGSP